MNARYYASSRYLTPDLRARFLADEEKLAAIHVDIALPSHPNQIEIMDRAGQYTHESQRIWMIRFGLIFSMSGCARCGN